MSLALCRDNRCLLTISSYLVAFKPPAKEMAINALEDLWNNCRTSLARFLGCSFNSLTDEEAKASVRPLLTRVRPSALGGQTASVVKKEESSTPAPVAESTPTVRTADSPAPQSSEPSPKPVVAAG